MYSKNDESDSGVENMSVSEIECRFAVEVRPRESVLADRGSACHWIERLP